MTRVKEEHRPQQHLMLVSLVCSLYKHCFVLIQHELGEGLRAYLDIIGTRPLHSLYGVNSRDGRKDCNNRDSLAHRMRGTIEAGEAETWGLISVQECPLPLSICSSGESQQPTFLFSLQ